MESHVPFTEFGHRMPIPRRVSAYKVFKPLPPSIKTLVSRVPPMTGSTTNACLLGVATRGGWSDWSNVMGVFDHFKYVVVAGATMFTSLLMTFSRLFLSMSAKITIVELTLGNPSSSSSLSSSLSDSSFFSLGCFSQNCCIRTRHCRVVCLG